MISHSSTYRNNMAAHGVEVDIVELVKFIQQLGTAQADGSYTTTFGVLFKSDEVQNTLESLAGTLKAAKKRKLLTYGPELLLQGVSDKEVITLLKQA